MSLPERNMDGNFSDPEDAAQRIRDALIRDANGNAEFIDQLAEKLTVAIAQMNRKPFLCRLFGCRG